MEIYTKLTDIKRPFNKSYVTIGNFDGVHLGHHMLFSEVVGRAYREKGESVAITFEPHPLRVLKPEIGIKFISTYEQKMELIELAGLDHRSRRPGQPGGSLGGQLFAHRFYG